MIILQKATELQRHLDDHRLKSEQIGFVPTMGALHDGHLSLLKNSIKENKLTVCSIFVNPAQFNDPSDFKKYPSTIDEDIVKLETNGCDVLFLPNVEEMYPEGFEKKPKYDLGYLDTILEGEFRPGHFQGVCIAVDRLLSIVQPDRLYLGQKDYQQCMIIARLIELMGLGGKVEIKICPILRENDGLAMSSRNMRLTKDQRAKAPAIYETLVFLKDNICNGSLRDLKKEAMERLEKNGLKPDYVEIADAKTLKAINEWDARTNILGLIAAYVDSIRLIDNMMLK